MTDIHLSDEDRAFIGGQLQAGAYRTADDVIRAGLQVLREEDEELWRLIKVGEDDIKEGCRRSQRYLHVHRRLV